MTLEELNKLSKEWYPEVNLTIDKPGNFLIKPNTEISDLTIWVKCEGTVNIMLESPVKDLNINGEMLNHQLIEQQISVDITASNVDYCNCLDMRNLIFKGKSLYKFELTNIVKVQTSLDKVEILNVQTKNNYLDVFNVSETIKYWTVNPKLIVEKEKFSQLKNLEIRRFSHFDYLYVDHDELENLNIKLDYVGFEIFLNMPSLKKFSTGKKLNLYTKDEVTKEILKLNKIDYTFPEDSPLKGL